MRCSVCEEKIIFCDNCQRKFEKHDNVLCCGDTNGNHFCNSECYTEYEAIEEGEVI